jgi:hypothetical protein
VGKGLDAEMKKKVDWPIVRCWDCNHLDLDIIDDAHCDLAKRRLWTNDKKVCKDNYPKPKDNIFNWMPDWCPLEDWIE